MYNDKHADSTPIPAVTLENVAQRFGNYTAVQGVNLQVGPGEFVAVVGPTGCGKSTLLNIIAGIRPPADGEVRIFNEALHGLNRRAGYLFQQDALLPWKTALENVALGLTFAGEPRQRARELAGEWLATVGLTGFGDRYPHQLSGGMRKRVALAQVLIMDPKILLMDEPFSALDVQTRQLMENELLRLWEADQKSVLFITHDLEEAIALADRVVVMSAGPASRPIGDFPINLTRPRDVTEIRLTDDFLEIHREIWELLREEVMRAHGQA